MRKLQSFDITGEDTQQCLKDFNDNVMPKLGIAENDVVSVSREWHDDEPAKSSVTLWVFYWQPEM